MAQEALHIQVTNGLTRSYVKNIVDRELCVKAKVCPMQISQ